MARTDLEIEQYIDNINWNTKQWQRSLDDLDTSQLDEDIKEAVLDRLVTNFIDAMDEIDEYTEGPLRDHLIDMLWNGEHVIVENGEIISIFDANYAGNYEDIVLGQIAAGTDFSKSALSRSIGWRNIYEAANYGIPVSKKASYDEATYSQIIYERLAYWGESAPYWIFVEFGTAGAGDGEGIPYPSFSGKNPVYKTQQQAIRIARQLVDAWYDNLDDTLSTHIDEVFVESRTSISSIQKDLAYTWTKSFKRGQYLVQAEQLRGKFTGRYRIIGAAD